MLKRGLLDRLIGWVAPSWGVRRAEAQAQLRFYDAAKVDRTRGRAPIGNPSPFAESANTRQQLLAASRDLDRNNAFAHGLFNSLVDMIVAEGIRYESRIRFGGAGGRMNETKNKAAESAFARWARACDPTGQLSFVETQALVERELWVAGEVLVLRSATDDDREVPLAIEVVPTERLADSEMQAQTLSNGNRIYQGVEVDSSGRVVAYHIFRDHPGDPFADGTIDRIEADRVLHLYHSRRPGEFRGTPRAASAVRAFESLGQYLDAELTKANVAAAVAFLHTKKRQGISLTVNGQDTHDDYGNAVGQVVPGTILSGDHGDDLTVASPSLTSTAFDPFAVLILRMIGAGMGTSYELVSRDLSRHNFASLRQGMLQDRRLFRCRQRFLDDKLCDPVLGWFLSAARTARVQPFLSMRDAQFEQHEWMLPHQEWIDPLKDLQADLLAVKSGLKSIRDVASLHGFDIVKNAQDFADFRSLTQELGVELPELFGAPAPPEASQETDEDQEDDGSESDLSPEKEALIKEAETAANGPNQAA